MNDYDELITHTRALAGKEVDFMDELTAARALTKVQSRGSPLKAGTHGGISAWWPGREHPNSWRTKVCMIRTNDWF